MQKSSGFLLVFTLSLGFSSSQMAMNAPQAEEKARDPNLREIITEAIKNLTNAKDALITHMQSFTEQSEREFAELSKTLEAEKENEKAEFDQILQICARAEKKFEELTTTVAYKRSLSNRNWPEYIFRKAMCDARDAQKAVLSAKEVNNATRLSEGEAKKNAEIAALQKKAADDILALTTKADAELAQQIDEGYLKTVEQFNQNPQAHSRLARAQQSPARNPLSDLLEAGLFDAAFAVTDLNVRFTKWAYLENRIGEKLGQDHVEKLKQTFDQDPQEASRLFIEMLAQKQNRALTKKAANAEPAGLLDWLWVKPKPQQDVADEPRILAECEVKQKALEAFLRDDYKFAKRN